MPTFTRDYDADAEFIGPATSTFLVSSANPSVYLDPVTFDSVVSGGAQTPTGTVAFYRGIIIQSMPAMVNGAAQYIAPGASLTLGSQTFFARYSGEFQGYDASDSAPLIQVVKALTTTVLESSLNPSFFGDEVIFTATVTTDFGTITGTVTFKDGDTVLSVVPLVAGVGQYTTSSLTVGDHVISATYSGDGEHFESDDELTQVVLPPTSMTLVANPNPACVGDQVTLIATVTPSSATGTVSFYDGVTLIGDATLVAGVAILYINDFALGTHALTAQYPGDETHEPAEAAVTLEIIDDPEQCEPEPPSTCGFVDPDDHCTVECTTFPTCGTPVFQNDD